MNRMNYLKTALLQALFVVLALLFACSVSQSVSAQQLYQLDPATGVLKPYTQTQNTEYWRQPNQYQQGYTNYNANQLRYRQQLQQVQQLLALIEQLKAHLEARVSGSYYYDYDRNFDYNYGSSYSYGDSEIEVYTRPATRIEDDRARLNGEVDFNRSDYAYLWFEWGEDDNDLDERTSRIRRDDDEDEEFGVTITRLDEDERYFFRAVGEDDRGRKDYGSIRAFVTDRDGRRSRDDDEPDVETGDADNITDDSAVLEGEVDMNDFNNGKVFIVYGEDEDQIDDVEDDFDSFSDVDEDGDDLQKELVDSDLDGRDDYRERISGLDDNTDYYYAYCVEFEDEDDDDKLICGSTEEFETD